MNKNFLLLFVAASPFVGAQHLEQESIEEIAIDEVVVTASPLGLTQEHIAGSINLIDQGELERSAAANLGDALNGQLGVASSSFGPGVGAPVIRGQSGKRVQVLNDGIRVADVSDTSADHAIAAEIGQVRQVEVIRGPATLRYGPGAIGGVVNLVERVPGDNIQQGLSGSVAALYSDNSSAETLDSNIRYGIGQYELSASITDRNSGNVSIPGFADLEADDADETTDGYIANTDADSRAYGAGLRWQSDMLEWGIELKQLDNQYGVPPGAHGHAHGVDHVDDPLAGDEPEEFVRIDLEQRDFQSYLKLSSPFEFIDSLEFELASSEYEHTEIEIEEGISSPGTFFSKESTEFSIEAVHPFGNWLSYSGLSLTKDDFIAVGVEAFVPPSETSSAGIYWVQHRDFSNLSFDLGARLDKQKIESAGISSLEDNSLNLSGSLLYSLDDQTQIGFILSRSERAPSAEELLSDGEHIATNTYEIGDINLDNEVSNNIELTYRHESVFSMQASIFYNDFESYLYEQDTELLFNHDLADLGASGLAACTDASGFDDVDEADAAVECFQYRQEGATVFGMEAEASMPLSEQISVRIWADQVYAELDNSGDVPRMPPTRVGLTLFYETENWYSSLALLQAADQDRPGENQETTEGYTKLDAYLGYRLENWDLYGRINNLTNADIRNSTSFLREIAPEAGRSVILGLRYHF
jgi:iron complex outermembrane recepter protein